MMDAVLFEFLWRKSPNSRHKGAIFEILSKIFNKKIILKENYFKLLTWLIENLD